MINKTFKFILFALFVLALAAGCSAPRPAPYAPIPPAQTGGSNNSGNNNNGYAPNNGYYPNNGYGYGPGMMGGSGRGGYGNNSGRGGYGNGYGGGMMGGGMMGRGYGYGYNGVPQNIQPLTIDEAKNAAQTYLTNLNISNLEIGEVMIFDNNAYVIIEETDTKLGAFELLVDPVSKYAYPEYGPNMMWNVKYGYLNHGGMMGGRNWNSSAPANVAGDMTVTKEQAVENAQAFLDANINGATAADDPIQFYGYYTLDFEKDGKIIGMLSVNGFTGGVFLHTWHGTFIEESE